MWLAGTYDMIRQVGHLCLTNDVDEVGLKTNDRKSMLS